MYTRSASGKQQSLMQQSVLAPEKTKGLSTTVSAKGNRIESLDDLFSRLQTMFDETNAKIDKCKIELQSEISTLREEVQQFKADCSIEVGRLADSIFELRSDVALNSERILCAEKANDLVLSGVPFTASENVDLIVRKTAMALGYGEHDLPLVSAKRLGRIPIAAGSTPLVALQFAFKLERNEFYSRYLRSRKLTLEHLGFNINKRG